MNRQIWIIFLLITSVTVSFCQITDDFESQNLSEVWFGDRDNFSVDAGRLRLQAPEAGQSQLWSPMQWIEHIAWEIDFMLDFNPSNQNQLRIYLFASDTTAIPSSALFLEMGETGSNDAINLFYQAGEEMQLLASGSLGTVARSPSARLTARIEDEILSITIEEDDLGRYDDDIMASVAGLNINGNGFFGMTCIYTSTRSDKFFFDNICVGEPKVDSIPPLVSEFSYINGEFIINWSEPILNTFEVNIRPSITDLNTALIDNEIRINGSFDSGIDYEIELINVTDRSGNATDTVLHYMIARSPLPGDLLINEILFNPVGSGSDYLEIINTTMEVISLDNVYILNAESASQDVIEAAVIGPGAIMLFTDDIQNTVSNYPTHNEGVMVEQNLPAWNNDDGNASLILDNTLIDAMDYDEDQHLAVIDDVNGVSLERKSLARPSNDNNNWGSAAGRIGYGTPGVSNSITVGSSGSDLDISIEIVDKVISPNDDGQADELTINYSLNEANYVSNVRVYTDSGILRNHIIRNETLASSGEIIWDGRDDIGQLVEQGIYILHVSMFNLEGKSYQKNLSFAVAYPD